MAAPKMSVTVGGETFEVSISRERLRQLRKNSVGKCNVAACDRKTSKGGLCRKHYAVKLEGNRQRYAAKR